MSKARSGSSRKERRSFSPEFKEEAVRLMRERKALGVSLAQIGRELDLRPDRLRAWTRQLEGRAGASARGGVSRADQPQSAEDELRQVRRENVVLRQERDFLKKAAAFFAKESR